MNLCPHCLHPLRAIDSQHLDAWSGFKSFPVQCENCQRVEWVEHGRSDAAVAEEVVNLQYRTIAEKIPPLTEETKIYIINREHPKHLEPGVIIRRSHVHYRVQFNDGTMIWMPEHWIQAIPSEML